MTSDHRERNIHNGALAPIGRRSYRLGVALLVLFCVGCHTIQHQNAFTAPSEGPPRELNMAILPEYVIEPPDVLAIEVLNVTARALYRLHSPDLIRLSVLGTLIEEPIDGLYRIEQGGVIFLGGSYGLVKISGMTVIAAQQAVEAHLKKQLLAPRVTLTLVETAATPEISGEYQVAEDGRVTLGSYGSVSVVGLTIKEATHAIEKHLSQDFDAPEVSVDVSAYNSKVYYVITQGAGSGDGVHRFSITGNDTVIDAISNINGFGQTSSSKMWIARSGPDKSSPCDVMSIDWQGIAQYGDVTTNYQLMPGDRVYVTQDGWVAFDTKLGKITAPFERIMGFSMLAVETATRFSGRVLMGGAGKFF